MRQNAADQRREVSGEQYSTPQPVFQAFKSHKCWSRAVAHDSEKALGSANRGLAPTVSVSNRDWTLWTARDLFILAWPPYGKRIRTAEKYCGASDRGPGRRQSSPHMGCVADFGLSLMRVMPPESPGFGQSPETKAAACSRRRISRKIECSF